MQLIKDKFLNYIQFEKRYSQNTFIAYKNDLEKFFEFIEIQYRINNISEVNHTIIRTWLVNLKSQNISNRSINRKISTLNKFYKYLLRESVIEINPMHKVISPKNESRLPTIIEEGKLNKFLDNIEQDGNLSFNDIRDNIILELFYNTGIRLSELINIRQSSINWSNNSIKVLGKRNKERIVLFSNSFSQKLLLYLNEINQLQLNHDFLIITNDGSKTYPMFIYRLIRNKLGNVTLQKKRSPHVLRHSIATHLLDNGAPLNAIKEMLGHESLAATQIYTHNSIDKLKKAYQKAHPKEQINKEEE